MVEMVDPMAAKCLEMKHRAGWDSDAATNTLSKHVAEITSKFRT